MFIITIIIISIISISIMITIINNININIIIIIIIMMMITMIIIIIIILIICIIIISHPARRCGLSPRSPHALSEPLPPRTAFLPVVNKTNIICLWLQRSCCLYSRTSLA